MMAYERVYLCDLCEGEGKKSLSVATYENDEGEEYSCCAIHLKSVHEAALKYETVEGMEEEMEDAGEVLI